jgi:hypothetical protein
MSWSASPFIIDDAIVRLAQPLTKTPKQLPSSSRRTGDLIEELGWGENFYLNHAGGSSGRTTRAVFYHAHFPDKLPGANFTKKDRVAIDFSEYLDGAAE